ncbi:MAG: CPBP family intramembrane metalloprotease [Gemmatimonadetes bacterium]|uniref:CPBP family intramembrane metalloprotease n=1 Tax=Candidatus Kutchimonas denitrificans TaxID=3056748 RepID=A0AAE4ZAG0_9BACT|nr:CPBP family intramembrane metalloprotease [Gemmatimonadota bacterium]NIR76583.1 CPBP family intramembrane metalloprotease [Candidatus Kutchimonas denitrificans]NIS01139.1 CPBP family intramembrane metalloprotease [Gemmatimonadota bacterium]NIT66906.1 CPBP family intramembrane metalloprotease [Gemmatimonadota bacterium]NIU54679.1 CPBP family intramembrane metalloprotease [Gemmatimonadota bacterium]
MLKPLLYGPTKLRAIWRILIFFALSLIGFIVLYVPAAALAPGGLVTQLALYSLAAAIAMLVASAMMMNTFEGRPLAAVGLPGGREAWSSWLRGAALGGAFIALLAAIQLLAGWLSPVADPGTFFGWLGSVTGLALLLAVAAFVEELWFRGYAFQVLVEGAGPLVAVAVSSVAFAALHLSNPAIGPLPLLNLALAGVLLAVAYLRTRSLWFATGLHWGWNWCQAAIFDLPVSGIEFDVPLYDAALSGPVSLTGGAFGPEGGLLTAVLAVPFIAWLARTRHLSESAAMKALDPLVDSRLRTEIENRELNVKIESSR